MATLTIYTTNAMLATAYDSAGATDAIMAENARNNVNNTLTTTVISGSMRVGASIQWTVNTEHKAPDIAYASEYFMTYDTSVLGAGVTINAVSLNMYSGQSNAQTISFPLNAYVTSSYSEGQFVNGNVQSSLTKVASISTVAGYPTPAPFTENGTAFRTALNKTGSTYLFVAASTMATDTVPTLISGAAALFIASTNQSETPYLLITYSVASSSMLGLLGAG